MSPIGSFRALHCGGPVIFDQRAVTALCLLFERVFLPGNLELVTEFAKTHEFRSSIKESLEKFLEESVRMYAKGPRIRFHLQEFSDEFNSLTPAQRSTAEDYLLRCVMFLTRYRELIGDVLETDIVPDPKKIGFIPEQSEQNRLSFSASLKFSSGEDDVVPKLLDSGYVPVAVSAGNLRQQRKPTAREIATLLAMRSVQMVFPAFEVADPAAILEARERLSDHLPPFWASMLRLSSELSRRIDENITPEALLREADELVNTVVHPSVIELKKKIEKERKSWLRSILGPATESLKLLLGRPGLAQQDLLTAAMLLGVNMTSTALEQVRNVSSLRGDSGLTYLLELEKVIQT